MANAQLWHLAQQVRQLASAQAEANAAWDDQAGAHIRGRYLRPHENSASGQVEGLRAHDRALERVGAAVREAQVHYEEARVAGELVVREVHEAEYAVSTAHDFIRRGLTNEGRASQLQDQTVAAAEQANAFGAQAPGEHGQTRVPISYAPLAPRPAGVARGSGGGGLTAGWRGTTMSDERSFTIHYEKHGAGRSAEQYANDALAWAAAPAGAGKPATLGDLSTGMTYRTPGGGPGGTLDADGAIVTFWYR